MTSRRSFLTIAGRGAAAVAVGAVAGGDVYAAQRGVFSSGAGPAYRPWSEWDLAPAPLRLVRAGVLAANAHNAQAWRFLVSPGRIQVFDDPSRTLGSVDPYRRELHLSLGCAVENIVLAAHAAGYATTVTLDPRASAEFEAPVATVELAAGRNRDSLLYQAIPQRHTDRGAYRTDRQLAAAVPRAMDVLLDHPDVRLRWLLGAVERTAFSELTVAATEDFIADTEQADDDYAWYRATREQIQRHRDGITVDAAGLSPVLRSLGKLTPAGRASNGSYWLAGTRDRQLPTAAGFGILLVRDAGSVAQRLAAGRLYQRLHLWATTQGIAMQPLNQALERQERERSSTGPATISHGLTSLVADPAWQPVMSFRLGYPTSTAPSSPRRATRDVIVAGT